MEGMRIRLSELSAKEIVIILDGRRLGVIVDLEIECAEGRILAIAAQGMFHIREIFKGHAASSSPGIASCASAMT